MWVSHLDQTTLKDSFDTQYGYNNHAASTIQCLVKHHTREQLSISPAKRWLQQADSLSGF